MPLPPEVANGTTVLPEKSQLSRKVSTILGAVYHHMGKPTKTASYPATSAALPPSAGRADGSFASVVLRLDLSVQFRSARVYGTAGTISYKSAPVAAARSFAARSVLPVQEKYATNIFLSITAPCPLYFHPRRSLSTTPRVSSHTVGSETSIPTASIAARCLAVTAV